MKNFMEIKFKWSFCLWSNNNKTDGTFWRNFEEWKNLYVIKNSIRINFSCHIGEHGTWQPTTWNIYFVCWFMRTPWFNHLFDICDVHRNTLWLPLSSWVFFIKREKKDKLIFTTKKEGTTLFLVESGSLSCSKYVNCQLVASWRMWTNEPLTRTSNFSVLILNKQSLIYI
jgi:hypothetical protein